MNKEILNVKNISKIINKKNILRNISFTQNEGDWIGILGHNGSGKTSLVEILSGVTKQTSGDYKYHFNDECDFRNHIGMQFQQTNFPAPLSVKNLIKLSIQSRKLKFDQKKVKEILRKMDMEKFYHRKASKLSGGERQKVNLIMSIIHKPNFIVLDEFSTGLDVTTKKQVLNTLLDIKKDKKISGIVISHDLNDINLLCNKVVVLKKGEVLLKDTVKNIKKEYGSIERFYFKKIDTRGAGDHESFI